MCKLIVWRMIIGKGVEIDPKYVFVLLILKPYFSVYCLYHIYIRVYKVVRRWNFIIKANEPFCDR